MEITILESTKVISMTDFPAVDGWLWILNPLGVTIYKNLGYEDSDPATVDYSATNTIVDKSIAASVDIFGNLLEGDYVVNVKTDTTGVDTYTASYSKLTPDYQPIISTTESCETSSTIASFSPALPDTAQSPVYSWVVTPPPNSGQPTITGSGETVEITPLVSGTYTVQFTVTWIVDTSVGGADTYIRYTRGKIITYTPSCGAAGKLACNVYETTKCLEKTWIALKSPENLQNWTIAANYMAMIQQSIACDDQAGGVEIYNNYLSWKGSCACCKGCDGK
jgi:hypothetical protein